MFSPGSVSFLWPQLLWLLALLPCVALIHVALVLRRRRAAHHVARLETVGAGSPGRRKTHALVPPILWFAALAALTLAVARPQASISLPTRLDTVVLALDMSGSMRGTDLAPTRLAAAQAAAKAFVAVQPRQVRIGVVAIAAAAAVVQSPTHNRQDVVDALERLEPQRGTALGSGLVAALDIALPGAGIDVEAFNNPKPGAGVKPGEPFKPESNADPEMHRAVAIVLLSDGQSNIGPEPVKAAELAAAHGVRIYTVGMGTTEGVVVKAEGWSVRTRLDEEGLKKIALLTEAEYFRATDAEQLKKIYRELGTKLGFQKQKPTEVTAVVAAFGALLALLAAGLSLLWFNRVL
jgi:Ca-activated chloride channel family protein